jgi:hypothetical protein
MNRVKLAVHEVYCQPIYNLFGGTFHFGILVEELQTGQLKPRNMWLDDEPTEAT